MMAARFMVMQDSHPILRGLTAAVAEQQCKEHERGYRTHSDSAKRRVPHFWVKEDPEVVAKDNANYRGYKQGECLRWD